MASCVHATGLDIEKLCLKLNNYQLIVFFIQTSVNNSTLYCEKCQIGIPNIWICLNDSCKFKGCGRNQNKHAQGHYSTSKHPIFFNPKSGLVWCLECEIQIINDNFALFRAIFGIDDNEKPFKAKAKGAVGLKNLGNTCYMNAGLQALSNIHSFCRFFRKVLQIEEIKARESEDLNMLGTLISLFRDLWKGEMSILTPKEFLQSFRESCPYFQGINQHDSQEFLRLLLDKLHESLKFEYELGKYRSIVTDTFKSEIHSKITCTICGNSIIKSEDYYDISLSIPTSKKIESYKAYSDDVLSPQERITFNSEKQSLWNKIQQVFTESKNSVSVYDCLLNFCLPENLKEEFFCEKCKKKTLSRREMKINKAANTLMILIKRFKFNKAGFKTSTFVQFPPTIDLRFFLSKNVSCQYQLTGMIQHIGGLNGGHYISYCKNYKTNKWFEFDDSRVSNLQLSQILEKEAYILFYQKKIPDPRERIVNGDLTSLLPTYWLNLYKTLSDPGPISMSYLICPHQNIRPQYSLAQFTKVSISQDFQIRQVFKCDSAQIESIEECENCLMEFSSFCVRAEMELELINELNSIQLFEGPWYIISTRWLDHWKNFCRLESFKNIPGEVDNGVLIKAGKIRKNLEKGKDYRGVNRHVWEAFILIYGGGPEIKRMTVDIYEKPAPEIVCEEPALSDEIRKKIDVILNLR